MANKFTRPFDVDLKSKYPARQSSRRKRKFTETKTAKLDTYQQILLSDLKEYYNSLDVSAGELDMDDLIGPDEAKNLAINYRQIESLGDVRELIGGECFAGQLQWILNQIQKFQTNQAAFKSFLDSTPVLQKVARSSIHHTSPAHNSQSCPNTVFPLTTLVATARPLDRPLTKKMIAAEASKLRKAAKAEANSFSKRKAEERKLQIAEIMRTTSSPSSNSSSA
ncbi:hypothetical protein PCASD_04830 [Puccinia coronata f. sp. avenae]|uniref:Uncharacterized protein n=1 Tax=Puccinia coronata f. sp. avenae TaxID=200324 RepID=A0A2N5V245_9BASI|nr:hypothetical protein PCASD_04830 [Puccinia coronata f. sp. avenae]